MNYDWVTDEMFEGELNFILRHLSGYDLLDVPGVSELVHEHFNNEVLKNLEDDRTTVTAAHALDEIAELLSGEEWDPTVQKIAEIVRQTGRDIEEVR